MEQQAFHVAVIGGGIGGLCLAQGLKKAGMSVAVYERDHSRTARLQGYRIHINPHGNRALYECLPQHLYDVFLATCGKSDKGFNFFTEQMKELLYVSAEDMGIKTESDPIDSHKSVSRFSLRQVLFTGLEEIVHFNKQFTRYEETPDGKMRAYFEDGTSITCDVLIGAEGGNSPVRKQFLPHAQRSDTGYRAIQGKTPLTDEIKRLLPSRLFDGPATTIAPHGNGLFIAVQEFQQKPAEIEEIADAIQLHPDLLLSDTSDFIGWGFTAQQQRYPTGKDIAKMDGSALKQVALGMTQNWHPLLQRLIQEADPTTVIFTPLSSAVPVGPWQTKRVTLLGDAIHSMTPFLGIGANTALRDARLLCQQLNAASNGEVPLLQAIHDYESEMIRYGFAAVLGSKKALEQSAALANPVNLAITKTMFRVMNALPPLKQRAFSGFGEE